MGTSPLIGGRMISQSMSSPRGQIELAFLFQYSFALSILTCGRHRQRSSPPFHYQTIIGSSFIDSFCFSFLSITLFNWAGPDARRSHQLSFLIWIGWEFGFDAADNFIISFNQLGQTCHMICLATFMLYQSGRLAPTVTPYLVPGSTSSFQWPRTALPLRFLGQAGTWTWTANKFISSLK